MASFLPAGGSGGGSGFVMPDSATYPFATDDARDTWAKTHLSDLINSQTITKVVEVWWLWRGVSNPAEYDPVNWSDVTPLIRGPIGLHGAKGDPGVIQSIVAGANIDVNSTDPANPVISATGGGGGGTSILVNGNETEILDTDSTIHSVYNLADKKTELTSPTDITPIDLDIDVYGNFNAIEWSSLTKDFWYRISGLGAEFDNAPYQLSASSVYNAIVYLNNDSDFYAQSLTMLVSGDWDNQMRSSVRGGTTKTAAESAGWKTVPFVGDPVVTDKLTITPDGTNKYDVEVDANNNTIINHVGTTYVGVTQKDSTEKENALTIGSSGVYDFVKLPKSAGKDLAIAENVKNYDSRFGVNTWFNNGVENYLQTSPIAFLEIPATGALTTVTHQNFGFVSYIKIIEGESQTKQIQVVGSNENATTKTIKVGEIWQITSSQLGKSTEPFWIKIDVGTVSYATIEQFNSKSGINSQSSGGGSNLNIDGSAKNRWWVGGHKNWNIKMLQSLSADHPKTSFKITCTNYSDATKINWFDKYGNGANTAHLPTFINDGVGIEVFVDWNANSYVFTYLARVDITIANNIDNWLTKNEHGDDAVFFGTMMIGDLVND